MKTPLVSKDFAEVKRIKLFERLSLFAGFLGIVHFFPDLYMGTQEAPIFDLILSVFTFGCYVLHRKGFHTASRILVLSFLNLFLTLYACVMSKEVGIYLYFLPLMTLTMAVFGSKQRVLRLSFTILSALLLLSLFLSDFNLIGSIQFESVNEDTFYAINLISCAFSLVICINFIVGVNEESEKRLRTLAEEIKLKNTDLEKTNSELDRFLYSTSHDLRAPLLSIKGLVNITRNESIRPEVQKYLSMIEERADRLDFFIRDIIDYSRNSRTGLSYDLVNIQQLVEEVQQNFQFLEGASMIDFQNEIIPTEVVVDRSRVMIILNNLISNAIKYHRLDQKNRWIKTTVNRAGNILSIMVKDNGQGIHADRKERVFEMFYRGTERSQGSGLGLYIVKEAVDKVNGAIHLESTEGEGTTFFVTIPLTEPDTAAMPEPARQPQKVSEKDSVVEAV
ncbi:MAG TPA: HAMP domain-containing sensor histidine kinase [Cyclobacteriaceae bacterium]